VVFIHSLKPVAHQATTASALFTISTAFCLVSPTIRVGVNRYWVSHLENRWLHPWPLLPRHSSPHLCPSVASAVIGRLTIGTRTTSQGGRLKKKKPIKLQSPPGTSSFSFPIASIALADLSRCLIFPSSTWHLYYHGRHSTNVPSQNSQRVIALTTMDFQ